MYKLPNNPDGLASTYIIRLSDKVSIPFNPDNTDYQAYLKWLDEGNTPTPAEEQV